MRGFRSPFHSAFWAIALAMVLPGVVFMFSAIRHRQLQSKANPRWAQFAKATGSKVMATPKTVKSPTPIDVDQSSVPIRTASLSPDESRSGSSIRHTARDTGLTGSITGQSSIEIPVRATPSELTAIRPESASERKPTYDSVAALRAVEIQRETTIELSRHFESQLRDVRSHLESLAQEQREYRAEDRQRKAQLLERENEVLRALKKITANASHAANAGKSRPKKPATVTSADSSDDLSMNDVASEGDWLDNSNGPNDVNHASPADDRSDRKSVSLPVVPVSTVSSPRALTENRLSAPPALNSKPPVAVTPAAASAVAADEHIQIRREKNSEGVERISMDVRNADIRKFFGRLSDEAHVDILLSPEVTGPITVSLHDVHFETALKAVLKSRGLAVEREGDIVIVCSFDEANRLKQNRDLLKKIYPTLRDERGKSTASR